MSNNAHELSNRLLNALDSNYNVVDMHIVNEIISTLEKINITKELLETTRLGKHVNELRRKTSDPTLARRAKVLVKRWRDLVIPTAPSPGHTGSNRSSAERQVRANRLGGTPLTSPALNRQVVSPAVANSRPPSRPAWGGYESDSQDVILVDDDPPPPPAPPPTPPASHLPTTKRPSPLQSLTEEKKAKRDKKPKKRRGHSRAGSGADTGGAAATGGAWPALNGSASPSIPCPPSPAPPAPPLVAPHRRNGCRRPPVDAYAALVTRMPPVGAKKVKTTKELLEEIQSRGTKPAAVSPRSPASPASPDVMLIEPDPSPPPVSASPLRNGSPPRPRTPPPPLEDAREYADCTCGEGEEALQGRGECPAAVLLALRPEHVHALHHAYLPGVNGTRAPLYPHQFAVRKATDPDRPGLFTSVVPLYMYSDYADDYCVKNMSQVPLCEHLPWTEFAPSPPPPEPAPSPPPPRPYPLDDAEEAGPDTSPLRPKEEIGTDMSPLRLKDETGIETSPLRIKEETGTDASHSPSSKEKGMDAFFPFPAKDGEAMDICPLSPVRDVKAVPTSSPPCSGGDEVQAVLHNYSVMGEDKELQFEPHSCSKDVQEGKEETEDKQTKMDVSEQFERSLLTHRTVERTKAPDGRALCALCADTRARVPYTYSMAGTAPVLAGGGAGPLGALGADGAAGALAAAAGDTSRDHMGRPPRATHFAEWHECARLGDLLALPYVVID